MSLKTKNLLIVAGVIFLILLIDQSLKIWVKTNMYIGESSDVNWGWPIHWFRIIFVENEGMAFGIRLPGKTGKLVLTVLRLAVSFILIIYIIKISKEKTSVFYLVILSMILAGALGNIIDSVFYGIFFTDSPNIARKSFTEPAKFVLHGGGYSKLFYGKVVDMIQFPLFYVNIPRWVPYFGGSGFVFFEPIFNIADSSIFIGTVLLILFGKKFVKNRENENYQNSNT